MLARRTAAIFAATAALTFTASSALAATPLPPVDKKVDLTQYAGTWNQIAVIPQIFQAQCVSNTKATYTLKDDGSVGVLNTCTTWIGSTSRAEGFATVENPSNNAELKVRFPFAEDFSGVPDKANYIITYLADDYSLAIVGSPDRKQGWVLSRDANISEDKWLDVKSLVEDRGYDSCKFLISPVDGGRWFPSPLCWDK